MRANGASPSTIRRWSTDEVTPSQRLDYWIGAICDGFLEMEATSPVRGTFNATLESAPCGSVGVNRVTGGPLSVFRTSRAIARSRENYFYLLCKSDSAWSVVQDQRTERLLPDDLVLIDSRRCYELHFPDSTDTVSLELPMDWLASWLADPAAGVARRIDGRSGWGQALGAFVRQMSPEMAVAPPLPAQLLNDQLGALLALATRAEIPGETASAAGSDALRERVLQAIGSRHTEPGLTGSAIALELGISERTLHRCLAKGGTTFARHLMACRMAVAKRMLADPRFDRLAIAEIGRRVGLCDASHFIRQCRAQLGCTPASFRRSR